MRDIERRIQRLEDREQLIRRKNEFCSYVDELDVDRVVSLFTPDISASYVPGSAEVVGTEAMRDLYRHALREVVACHHQVSNFEIDFIDDDHAEVHCTLTAWYRFAGYPEGSDRQRWARYLDRWVRTADGWTSSLKGPADQATAQSE